MLTVDVPAPAPPPPSRCASVADAPSPCPVARAPSRMATVDDTQPADGAPPIEQTQVAEAEPEVEPEAEAEAPAPAPAAAKQVPGAGIAALAAAANGTKKRTAEEANLDDDDIPTLFPDQKRKLQALTASMTRLDPKGDSGHRALLEDSFNEHTYHRTKLELEWQAKIVEPGFAHNGDEFETFHAFYNRALYYEFRVQKLLAKALSWDPSKPHWFTAKRCEHVPPKRL